MLDIEHGETITLPEPKTAGGLPVLDALGARRSSRSFRPDPLPIQCLSDLLWAAQGVNRPHDAFRRTAPTARNWQEIDLYVALHDGVYLYLPTEHALLPMLDEDVRQETGTQDFVGDAPVNLIFVADWRRMPDATDEERLRYEGADAGFAAQNVYLFCAASGLATVVRGSVDRRTLARILGLLPQQRIVLAQSVGFPGS